MLASLSQAPLLALYHFRHPHRYENCCPDDRFVFVFDPKVYHKFFYVETSLTKSLPESGISDLDVVHSQFSALVHVLNRKNKAMTP